MRNLGLGGGLLAVLLLVLGLVFVSGQGAAPAVQAQTTCEDVEAHCVVITKAAEADGEFSFTSNAGEFQLVSGESEPISVELTGVVTVIEAEAEGWTLDGIECDDGGNFSTVDGDTLTVDFESFDQDEPLTITCTFTNTMDEAETATSTVTTTTTATTTATPTTTTSAGSAANTPVVPTPIAPTPQPPASEVQSGSIAPPTTGDGGLK